MDLDSLVHRQAEALRGLLAAGGRSVDLPLWPRSAQALSALAVRRVLRRSVVVVSDSAAALDIMHRNLLAFAGPDAEQVLRYPPWESLAGAAADPDPDIAGERLSTLSFMQESTSPVIIVTAVQALMQAAVAPRLLCERTVRLALGQRMERTALSDTLAAMGYDFRTEVEEKGQAAVRGGLLDVWPPAERWPLRLEFFGDVLESVRTFDPVEQGSLERLREARLTPAGERTLLAAAGDAHADLFAHLPDDTLFVWSGREQIRDRAGLYGAEAGEAGSPALRLSLDGIDARVSNRGLQELVLGMAPRSPGPAGAPDFSPVEGVAQLAHDGPQPDIIERSRSEFLATLSRRAASGQRILLFFDTPGSLDRFEEMRAPAGLAGATVSSCLGTIHEGFLSEQLGVVVVSEEDLFGYPKQFRARYAGATVGRGPAKRIAGLRVSEWAEMMPGDLVVHVQHGIGKYLGLYEIELQGRKQEVLALEYAEQAKLYVPVSQAHLLSRYVGTGKHGPALHKLGGKRWQREKAGAQLAVQDLASSLLEVQASREALPGQAFSSDHPWQREFEAAFPYQETQDQQQALEDVRRDMERPRPMDRLICGDVGYGKTEVAMRAAFRTVMNGKQVAVLVPTTVLAQQHFDTFAQRMAAYPFRLEMLSRFRSKGRQRAILLGMAEQTVDIVIGTHALLQPGVRFKDLGLVIIDEEQRFGVEHKERLKQLRRLVDVLTLTATPIPRTLYMTLTGAKDVSTIQTPPQERLPVETIVAASRDDVIRDAIMRELNRRGQVYYLHNRVMTIERVMRRLARVVPEARIELAHGQMPSSRLAAVMKRFAAGECDVLLCTTIIESGLDIPNANTILIDRSDRFGMADLYQLRGRVGRSHHKGYAYLLLPEHGRIDEIARKRIGAIKQYSHFGASFKLALRDLEIRGAGNLLGAEQSGHITAVGFGLYCQLLKRTVARQKGERVPPLVDVDLTCDFLDLSPQNAGSDNSAVIPVAYMEDESMRVKAYRRVAEAAFRDELARLRDEFRDRFGPLPGALNRLLKTAEIRVLAAERRLRSVEVQQGKLMLKGGRNEFVMPGPRFPRLKGRTPDEKLDEIIEILSGLARPSRA
ncbi:MAG: transcription-repair coupling factor [Kiritimatiellae bacterium]|nr:transcription-repair coupling factor [Kiritimatiellia bacterium]